MNLKNNTAPLLTYFKLCASFRSNWWFKLELQSGNSQFGSKSAIFLLQWPWNLKDDLEKQKDISSYPTSSFVHYFVAISEFKLELQSGNTQFRSKLVIFCPMLKNNRAPLLTYFKLCVLFRSHWWIQTGITVQFGWKSMIFCPLWPWQMTFKQVKSEWFDSWNQPSNLTQTGFKFFFIFWPVWPWNWMDYKNDRAPPLMLCQVLFIISKHSVNSYWSYSPEMLDLSKIWQFFVPSLPSDLEIWRMTSKNNRALFSVLF